MKFEPIKINIENNWRFGLIAYLVDRDDFIDDLINFRKQIKFGKLISREELFKFEFYEDVKENKKKYVFSSEIIYHKKHDYDQIAEYLNQKYGKSLNLLNVIKYALLTGEVTEADLVDRYKKDDVVIYGPTNLPTYAIVPLQKSEYSQKIELSQTEIAIIITPESTKTDLLKIFNALDGYKEEFPDTWFIPDTISNIKRDRKWYWLHKEGKSYSTILNVSKERISKQGIIEAIKQYKKRLNIKL